MSNVNTIIHKIKEKHTGFNITDDYPVPDKLIYSFMLDVRETLVREEFNNNRTINDQYYQMTCCNEIICLTNECDYNGRPISNKIPVYKVVLKQLITRVKDLDLKFVGDKSGKYKYDRYSFSKFSTLDYRVFTKNRPAYTVIGNELWLRNLYTPGQKFICLLALLRDPTSACNWDEEKSSFPVPSEKKLVDLVYYELLNSSKVNDILNNAANDPIIPRLNQDEVAQQQQSLRADNKTQQNERRR